MNAEDHQVHRRLTSTQCSQIKLVKPNEPRLQALLSWFDCNDEIARWGGPVMRLPMTLQSLKEDARLAEIDSFFLVSQSLILGFGQFYRRLERCHLGRLAIAPEYRGQRLGATLIDQLTAQGTDTLKTNSESLFVLDHNAPAMRLYERCGFSTSTYSGDDLDLDNITYMTRESNPSP